MSVWLRRLFLLLVVVLVFEGVLRKALPGILGNLLFLAKDGIVALMLVLGIQRVRGNARVFLALWILFGLSMLPLILLTATHDPILAVFGAKQYILFPGVVIGMSAAYSSSEPREFVQPFRFLCWVIVPLAFLSVVQLKLSPDHWINRGIGGSELSGFSAGGRLRVSGTFSFVAQFSWFLLAWTYSMAAIYAWRSELLPKTRVSVTLLIVSYLICTYGTASRTAVLGYSAILLVASILIAFRGRGRSITSLVAFGAVIALGLLIAPTLFPEAFEGYEARSSGDFSEISGRLNYALLEWQFGGSRAEDPLFGIGLGVMSNGAGRFSPYAAEVIEQVGWGEVDLANTYLEGGYYLIVVWMGFRAATILYCLSIFMKLRTSAGIFAGAFAMGHLIVQGILGTMGIQPPLALWVWISAGFIMILGDYDRRVRTKAADALRQQVANAQTEETTPTRV